MQPLDSERNYLWLSLLRKGWGISLPWQWQLISKSALLTVSSESPHTGADNLSIVAALRARKHQGGTIMKEQFAMVKQMIDMQKASSDGMINGLIMMWEQTGTIVDGTPWLPEEGRKALREWVDMNRKACENLKSAIDSGYSGLEKFLGSTAQQGKPKA
jgi:hypothetical protein